MTIEWITSASPIPYPDAIAEMERRVTAIYDGREGEAVWLLEHPPLYTMGTGAKLHDLLEKERFPVFDAGRGGQFTYHGPGQRVGYVMLDLRARGRDVRRFVHDLEEMVILTLNHFGIETVRREGRVGVWVVHKDGREDKIAAIGVRLRRWISFHGFSINVAPDLSHYQGIVPCGISEHGVTSLHALGVSATMDDVDNALRQAFTNVFDQPAA